LNRGMNETRANELSFRCILFAFHLISDCNEKRKKASSWLSGMGGEGNEKLFEMENSLKLICWL
jgi:hypothetical protein